METEALMDFFSRRGPRGDVAKVLLANNMDTGALRTNDLLRKDEWKQLDDAVVQIARIRLVGVGDLIRRNLVYNLTNGLGTTVLEYEDISDMEAAEMNMDAITRGEKDRIEYSINYLPLPVIHKEFSINIRTLNSSRRLGQPLDTTQATVASRKVSEKVEDVLFNGASSYAFGGGIIYGYTDFPQRNTVTLSQQWTASGKTGMEIIDDGRAMKQASIDAKHYGPWKMYVPTNYETILDDDAKAESDRTVRQRILDIAGIEEVSVADKLAAHNVLLVEMSPETIRMVIGLQVQTVEWTTEGGFVTHFKVLTIMVPQPRADQDGQCGIVHLS